MSEQDPYCYPGSDVLRNLFDLHGQTELSLAEAEITAFRINELQRSPVAGRWDLDHLKEIHWRIFRDVYSWAGHLRTTSVSKDASLFCRHEFIASEGERIFRELRQENLLRSLAKGVFCQRLAYYFAEINALHPFREGNGRTQRVILEEIAKQAGYSIDFEPCSSQTMVWISREAHRGRLEGAIACFEGMVSPNPSV